MLEYDTANWIQINADKVDADATQLLASPGPWTLVLWVRNTPSQLLNRGSQIIIDF